MRFVVILHGIENLSVLIFTVHQTLVLIGEVLYYFVISTSDLFLGSWFC